MSPSDLSSDRPLTDPVDDRLGYGPFARRLAESIIRMPVSQGMVLAVYGAWGSGKSTLVNFIELYIGETPELERPLVIRFNPWWFAGTEDMTRRFIEQLGAPLKKGRAIARKVAKKAAQLADALSEAPASSLRGVRFLARLLTPRARDVTELKQAIVEDLARFKRKVLVIIDDVDRLSREELRQLFSVIKAVGDFPQTVYLLALDRSVVVAALGEIQGVSGEDYLEKIVQVPFELPMPDQTALRTMLTERLNAIIAETRDELFIEEHWTEVFLSGIDPFIHTPRDVVRITNALSVTYPAVEGEVNGVDFIGVEVLRLMTPTAYEVVRRNSEQFTGSARSMILGGQDPIASLRSFHDAWLSELTPSEKKHADPLLQSLFPKFAAARGQTVQGAELEARWRRELRVCSGDVFPVYFRLAVPASTVSAAEVRGLLALVEDQTAFKESLLAFFARDANRVTGIKALLARLEDFADSGMDESARVHLLHSLFDIGDELIRLDEPTLGFFDTRMTTSLGRVTYRLIRGLPAADRTQVLLECIESGRALATMTHEVAVLGQQQGKYEAQPSVPSDRFISEADLGKLESAVAKKIDSAAAEGWLLQIPDLAGTLYRWADWGGSPATRDWVASQVQSDAGLARILDAFLQSSTVYTSGPGRRSYVRHYLDPRSLEPFIDPESVIDRVPALVSKQDLTARQRLAAQAFLKGWDLRQSGKDPRDEDSIDRRLD
jgi:predicted KAP-like P-loop ATPase